MPTDRIDGWKSLLKRHLVPEAKGSPIERDLLENYHFWTQKHILVEVVTKGPKGGRRYYRFGGPVAHATVTFDRQTVDVM